MALEDSRLSGVIAPDLRGVSPVQSGAVPRATVAFKDLLRFARLEQGLSFHQLAERSHVDVAYLHRLEDGRAARPGRNVTIRIAIGLGLNLDASEELLSAAGQLGLLPQLPIATHRPEP